MEHQQASHHHTDHRYESLIQQLISCFIACEKCTGASLEEEDVTAMAHCIELTRDCAELCQLAAKLLMRDSGFARELVQLCATVCTHCAEECAKHEHQHCKHCAQQCTECATVCHALAENSL